MNDVAAMRSFDEQRGVVQFGRWQLLPHGRELLLDGSPVHLGSRAFDILTLLVEADGELVSKDEILSRVWPGIVVEENTLQAHVYALRKVLGADRDYLKTVSGRGYQFTADIVAAPSTEPNPFHPTAALTARPASTPTATNLPIATSDLIGREAEVAHVVDFATSHRLVTLVGAGGIGKTRLGLEVARHLLPRFTDGVWVAELASLSDPDLVAVTVAAALGVELATGASSPERLAAAVGSKQLLLVLDNCEHVIEAAARLVETLLRAGPAVFVMTTSREPLRADGEFVYRVPPLEVPALETEAAEDLLRAGAVRLFIARARAADAGFSLDPQVATIAAAICRRLDGIPLAIELAAASAVALGVEGLARRLDDRFWLLTGGRRTALPRHQTLRATLDWSYELLSECERLVLRRLSIFAGSFTLDAASTVAQNADVAVGDVVDCVAGLVAKSLVTADASGPVVGYRLLKTTRAYALEKLIESGEFEAHARAHAEYFRVLFESAETGLETQPAAAWLAVHSRWIDDVRAALDWAFSLGDDEMLGVALTVATVPLWLQMSLMQECHERVERALASVDRGTTAGTRREMQLYAALGASVTHAKGPGTESCAAWTKALEIAQSLGDTEYQLRALCGLWIHRIAAGEYRIALALAERFCGLAASTPDATNRLIGDRLMGVGLHYLGDQVAARPLIERMPRAPVSRSYIIRFQLDQRVTALAHLARILWLQGFPEQAMRTAQSAVEDAQATDHALSICYALAAAACPVAFLVGDLIEAERYVAMLLERSAGLAFGAWNTWGQSFAGLLTIKRGDAVGGTRVLHNALDALAKSKLPLRYTSLFAELAHALGRSGEIAQGLAVIDRVLERCERHEERWCIPELLRVKGELLLLRGSPDVVEAVEVCLVNAIDCARQQGAQSWELRAATSLARIWCTRGRGIEAHELLGAVYGRFTEGLESADLRDAKACLDECHHLHGLCCDV